MWDKVSMQAAEGRIKILEAIPDIRRQVRDLN
jgi:hypothetical protein